MAFFMADGDSMEGITQAYKTLLAKEIDSLEMERKKEYDRLAGELVDRGLARAEIHIEQALELEKQFLRRLVDYAIAELGKLLKRSDTQYDELETIYRDSIDSLSSKSLLRMLGITVNVRSSFKEDSIKEQMRTIRLEALQALQIAKTNVLKDNANAYYE